MHGLPRSTDDTISRKGKGSKQYAKAFVCVLFAVALCRLISSASEFTVVVDEKLFDLTVGEVVLRDLKFSVGINEGSA